ncbi:hypothetical protein PENANT_c001G05715 [Penicillium antarcticum]|uniref:Uncharacterized protein n=1 Tax=Penicillium antarcticum TaxID=416450 RepID=A0A1V6QNV4_9EURO|nr:hypothetical protein PENANT_c001G05715 [Penicillium antarcticum]
MTTAKVKDMRLFPDASHKAETHVEITANSSATGEPSADAATIVTIARQGSHSISSDFDNNDQFSVAVTPTLVESSTRETTSTTIVTVTTSVKHIDYLGKNPSTNINVEDELSYQKAESCGLASVLNASSSESKASSEDTSDDERSFPGSGLFWCIHCERLV